MAAPGVSLNVSWAAPPLAQLSLTNCSAVTPWMAYFLTGADASGWDLAPYHTAVDFVASLVPDGWAAPPGAGDAMLWYTAMAQGDYFLGEEGDEALENITMFALVECGADICPHLDWDGDADLSVRGTDGTGPWGVA